MSERHGVCEGGVPLHTAPLRTASRGPLVFVSEKAYWYAIVGVGERRGAKRERVGTLNAQISQELQISSVLYAIASARVGHSRPLWCVVVETHTRFRCSEILIFLSQGRLQIDSRMTP